MSIVLLVVQSFGLGLVANAVVEKGFGLGWIPALVTSELAPIQGVAQLTIAVVWWSMGWSGGWAGGAAMVTTGLSLVGLGVLVVRSLRARRVLAEAARASADRPTRLRRPRPLARPVPGPRGLDIVRDLAYGDHPRHRFDRIRVRPWGPVVVQVHGGGWWRGRRERQARPLMYRMARAGWTVFNVGYRLSPEATYPDHLVDVKRALAWIRAHADELEVDASFVAITGGSAGGQLAAAAALTMGRLDLQPGFEDGDATVQACVPLYGVHDLLADGRPRWAYLETSVLKVSPLDDPERWTLGSPVRLATADRPPFWVVHGADDSVIGPEVSRRLTAELGEAGGPPLTYVEVPGAQHGFDYFDGIRGAAVADAVAHVLDHLHVRHHAEGR